MNTENQNIKQRAEAGDPEAQLAYGLSLRWEQGVFARVGVIGLDAPCEAQMWIQKAADQGHAPAQFVMGKIYDAQGIWGSAIAYYRQAADQGHQPAKRQLEQSCVATMPGLPSRSSLPTLFLPTKVPPVPPFPPSRRI